MNYEQMNNDLFTQPNSPEFSFHDLSTGYNTFPVSNTPYAFQSSTPINVRSSSYSNLIEESIAKLNEIISENDAMVIDILDKQIESIEKVKLRNEIELLQSNPHFFIEDGKYQCLESLYDSNEVKEFIDDDGCIPFNLRFLVYNYCPDFANAVLFNQEFCENNERISTIMHHHKGIPSSSAIFRSYELLGELLHSLGEFLIFKSKEDSIYFGRYVRTLRFQPAQGVCDFYIPDIQAKLRVMTVRSNNQGYLVGVETNPGPLFFVSSVFLLILLDFYCRFLMKRMVRPNDFVDHQVEDEGFVDSNGFHPVLNYRRNIVTGGLVSRNQVANNQGFLVGIETNPGPLNFLIPLIGLPIVYVYMLRHANAYLDRVVERVVQRDNALPIDEGFVDNDGDDFMNRHLIHGGDVRVHIERPNNQGFLVGVEPNPGPPVLSTARSLNSGIFAQMQIPFSVGLDTRSIDLISEISEKLDSMLSNGLNVNHDVNPNVLSNAIDPLIQKLSSYDVKSKAYKMVFTILLCLIGSYVSFRLGKAVARLIVSTLCSVRKMDESAKVAMPFCEAEAQIGSSEIVTGLLSYLYYQVVNKSIEREDLSLFMSGCEKLVKQKEGLASFVDFVLAILQKFSTFLTRSFNIPDVCFTSTGDANIDELQSSLNNLLSVLRKTGLYNAEHGKIAYDLEAKLRKLKASVPRSREFSSQHRAIYDLELSLKPVISRFERNNIVGNGPRSEPLAVMLGGPSGVGKSTATVPILLAVMAKVLPEERLNAFIENHNDFIWNFVPENHFHDAFHGQFCTIIDEAGFCRDSVGMPDPGAMGAIRFINTACFPLTMAHLEDKGNTNFNSELVFATTNRNFFKWDSMYSSEAYVRRFKIAMLAVPKEKYCLTESLSDDPWKRRLDLTKISVSNGVFDEDVPEYIPWNFLTGTRAAGPILDFHGLVDKMVSEFSKTREKGDALLDAHKDLKSRYVTERLKAQIGDEVEGEAVDDSFNIFENLDFFDFSISNPIKVLSLCVAVASGMWYLFKESIGDQSGDVKSKRAQKRALKKSFRARPVGAKGLKAQHGANANVVAGSRKVMKRSVYRIFSSENKESSVYATFVKGRACIVPAHFFHAIQSFIDDKVCSENPIIIFERCSTPLISFEVRFEDLEVFDLREEGEPENDLFVCLVPKVIPSHPDITEYFKPVNDDISRSRFEAMLAKPDGKDILFMCTQAYPSGSVSYHPFEVGRSFKYDLPTRTGDCGSLLFSVGPTAGRAVIVGMHIAGNGKNVGISTRLDYEMIKAIPLLCDAPTVLLDDVDDVEFQMGDNFLVAEEALPLPLPSKNMVVKSKLYGKFNEPKCAPSMLREMDLGDGVKDPWQFARSKYSRPQKSIDLNLLEVVACGVSQSILYSKKFDDPWDARLYSFEEAVRGIPGVNFAEGIPRNTSSGYPFSLGIKLKGKKDWFGSDNEYDFSSSKCLDLKSSIHNSIVELEKGFRMKVIYADYLKDERRPVEKVIAGKTRLISASPLDYLIICRMYFGDFVRAAMSGRVNNGMAVGLNPYSTEWSFLVQHLQSVGDNCIFGDYSAYDGSLPVSFMYKALDIIEDFYASAKHDPQDSVVRAALFEDIVNSRHLCVKNNKSFVYEWFGSNPSGNFLTTILNSVCNLMLIRYAACKVAVSSGKYTGYLSASTDFTHNVRCVVFGDDNGISVSDEWATFLDQVSFTKEMSKIGMVYTDEAKSDSNDLTHRHITECSFLKRAFKYDAKSRRWDAPLEKSTIEEMCNWTKKSSGDKDLMNTIDSALKEAAFHGEKYYNEFANRLRSATLEELDYVPVVDFKSSLVSVRSLDLAY